MAEFHPLRSAALEDDIPTAWKEANTVAEALPIPCIPLTPHLQLSYKETSVYAPAEDTYLLIDAVCYDLQQQSGTPSVCVCLEIGCGSGVVLEAICRISQQPSRRLLLVPLATDLNPRALQVAQQTLKDTRCDFIQCDLASAIRSQSIDVMVFNPPYVPTPDAEVDDPDAWAWAGGTDGRRVIDRWMVETIGRVLKRPHGVAYLITVDENRPHAMAELLWKQEHAMVMRPLARRRAKNEYLSVQKITYLQEEGNDEAQK